MFGIGPAALLLNRYTMTAVAALGLLTAAYGTGYMAARGKCQAAALRAEVAGLRKQIAIRDDTIAAHNKRVLRDAEAMAGMDRKLQELQAHVDQIPDGDCLSDGDTRRLRDAFGAP